MLNYTATNPLYLDYNATTPVDARVLDAMLPWFSQQFGNASSNHPFGWRAEDAVKTAREAVASLIGGRSEEIVFTSGATEAVNLAIKGVAEAYVSKGKHIISFATEHKAVLDVLKYLSGKGYEVQILGVDESGQPDISVLKKALRSDTVLVCAMYANNETGVLFPVSTISELVHSAGALLFSDATQAVGKVPVKAREQGIDILALSAHKIYGPKGSGALYFSRRNPRVSIIPQMHGGAHEDGRRSGTLNVPGIVGLGKAAQLAGEQLEERLEFLTGLRNRLEAGLLEMGARIHGSALPRLPNTSSVRFAGVPARDLIRLLPEFAFSTGSACSSALKEPSHVLEAMGLSEEEALSTIRISLGQGLDEAKIDYFLSRIRAALASKQ